MRKTELLIEPVTDKHAWKETTYKDFVSREEFINRTGIFVTPSHFDYIYDMEFKESGMSVDEFISTYEEKRSGEVVKVPLQGTFKYIILDDEVSCLGEYEDLHDPNIWEIVNCLARCHAMEQESKWNYIEKYKNALQDSIRILTELQVSCQDTSSSITS